jgi:hypothetical protein
MTENLHDPLRARATRATGLAGLACLVALAVVTVAGCSSTAGSTAVRATSVPTSTVTVTPQAAPAASTSPSAPTVTVTVTPAPAPAPVSAPTAVAQPDGPGSFRSPSGNINCTLSTPGGENAARCVVVDHTWTAPPPPPDCHLNSGDRFYLTQGGAAVVGCYAQEFPVAESTLGYGQSRSFGSITCDSEYTGMACTDSSTGHYFRVSRDTYELG